MSKPSGFTQSITILPVSGPASPVSRSRWPSQGTATITTSAAAAASALAMPRIDRVPSRPARLAAISVAAVCARSMLREPMMTGVPAAVNRCASPRP